MRWRGCWSKGPGYSVLMEVEAVVAAVVVVGCSSMVLGEVYPAQECKVYDAIVFDVVFEMLLATVLSKVLEKTPLTACVTSQGDMPEKLRCGYVWTAQNFDR